MTARGSPSGRPPRPPKHVRVRVINEVRHGGAMLRVGQVVILDAKDASPLLRAGHVEPVRPNEAA